MIFSAVLLGYTCLRNDKTEDLSEWHYSSRERREARLLSKYTLCQMAVHAKEKQQSRVLCEEEAPEIFEREPSKVLADKELE